MVDVSRLLLRPDTVSVRNLSALEASEASTPMATTVGASLVTCTQLSIVRCDLVLAGAVEALPLVEVEVAVAVVLRGVAMAEGMAGTPLEPPASTFAKLAIMSFALTVS